MSEGTLASALAVPVSASDHAQGAESAAVTLVLYGDYQCPFTADLHLTITRLQSQFGKDFRYVFRHFPLFSTHPQAQLAAETAEAAAAQGKFWDMHAYLFQRLGDFDADYLVAACSLLDLDYARLDGEISAHVHLAHIQADVDGAKRSGVTGTPTMFINGIRHNGDDDFESLKQRVEALAAANEKPQPPRGFFGALFQK